MPMAAQEIPSIAERLRRLRTAAELTQQELAVRANLSIGSITQIEQGSISNPRLDTLIAIADALGVSLDELAGRSGNKRR